MTNKEYAHEALKIRRTSQLKMGAVAVLMIPMYAIIAAFVAITLWPASWWVQDVRLTVPSHTVGEDPTVVLHRKVIRPFYGSWTTEVRSSQGPGPSCNRSGRAFYEIAESNAWTGKLYTDMLQQGCVLPPGCYQLHTTRTWLVFGLVSKTIETSSNAFCVQE
jgi:hypothetical protein